MSGALVLVGTPLGNLGDLAPRAAEALAGADVVACEDTRRTGRLLHHLGIKVPMVVVNDHTEHDLAPDLVARAAAGQRVALVSDAGMPAISDPGQRLVRSAVDAGVPVEVVPGPTAAVAALVVSGLPTDRFVFEGFLPRKGRERADRLAGVAGERRTVVLYEAPHRLRRTLDDLAAVAGDDRPVALGRELTKLHEAVWRGTLGEARARAARDAPRGEHVIVVGGRAEAAAHWDDDDLRRRLAEAVARGGSRREAVAEVVAQTGAPRRRVYDLSVGGGPAPG